MFRRPLRTSVVFAALLAGATLAAADARACSAPINLYPIRPNTGLLVFPGFTQQLITANLNNSWRVAWLGGSGVTHFTGRLRDASGGVLNVVVSNPNTVITRVSASEITYASTWNSSMEPGATSLDFVTSSPTVIMELHNDSPTFSITVYPTPQLTEGYPVGNPFAMTLNATGGVLADPEEVFCNGYE